MNFPPCTGQYWKIKGLDPIVFANGRAVNGEGGRGSRPAATLTLLLTTESRNDLPAESVHVRILVVDDNAMVRGGLRLVLQNHAGWKVCGEAADGVEAIEKYCQLKPDLLVIDLSMPQMNGLDAAREILKLFPKTLILLYTSFLTSQLMDVAHKAGIRGAVSKDAMHFVVLGLEALLRGEEYSGPPN